MRDKRTPKDACGEAIYLQNIGTQIGRNKTKDLGRVVYYKVRTEVMESLGIGLITVFDPILTGKQVGVKLQCLYENPMSNNFRKTSVLKKL